MAFPDKPTAHLLGSTGPVHAVAYSASPGAYILAGSADRSIRLYNPSSTTPAPQVRVKGAPPPPQPSVPQGRLIQTYSAHGYEVLSLSVTADNQSFASAGGDRAVFLWDVTTAMTIRRFGGSAHGHTARINCVQFAGHGDSVLASGGFDTSVRLWDVRSSSAKPIQVLDDARDAVSALVVRGPEVVAGSVDGRVRSYDVRTGKCTTDVIGASVTSLGLTKDGRAALVGSLDSKVRLMDRQTGRCLRAYADPAWKNTEIRMQSVLGGREKYIVAGDETGGEAEGQGRIWAWDLLTGRVVAKVSVPWGPVDSGDKRKKVVGRDGKEKPRTNVVSCIAWRDDGWGDQFCVGGTSGVVTVFDHK